MTQTVETTVTGRPTPIAGGRPGRQGVEPGTRRSSRRTLPAPAAFTLLMSVIVFFLAASSAPTPLYGTYQQMWHFSPKTTVVVIGEKCHICW